MKNYHFPSAANEWVRDSQNIIVKPMGDAIMLRECSEINETVRIHWSRQYNGTCYLHFPVHRSRDGEHTSSSSNNETSHAKISEFLVLSTRQIVTESPRIPCARRDVLFVVDDEQHSFKISKEGTIQETESLLQSLEDFHTQDVIEDIIGDHEEIILKEKFHLPPVTISEIMSRVYGAISDLAEVTEEVAKMKANQQTPHNPDIFTALTYGLGGFLSDSPSNVISALGKGLTDTVKAVGGAGSELIHAVGDAGSELIDSASEGIAKIFNKWVMMGLIIVVGLILLYLLSKHRSNLQFGNTSGNRPERPNPPLYADIQSNTELMAIIKKLIKGEVKSHMKNVEEIKLSKAKGSHKGKKTKHNSKQRANASLTEQVSAVKHIVNNDTNDGLLVSATILPGEEAVKLEALVDTGSPITLMKRDLWDEDEGEANPFVNTGITQDIGIVKSITGAPVEIAGSVMLPIAIGKQSWLHTVFLSDNIEFNLVLGMDFLKRIEAVVSIPGEDMQTKRGKAKIIPSKYKHPKVSLRGPFMYNGCSRRAMIGMVALWVVTVFAMLLLVFLKSPGNNHVPMACSYQREKNMFNSTAYIVETTTVGARKGKAIA